MEKIVDRRSTEETKKNVICYSSLHVDQSSLRLPRSSLPKRLLNYDNCVRPSGARRMDKMPPTVEFVFIFF